MGFYPADFENERQSDTLGISGSSKGCSVCHLNQFGFLFRRKLVFMLQRSNDRGRMLTPVGRSDGSLGVFILAAGRSTRMGRPKLLLPWGANSVLGWLIELWTALGARQVAVVCARDNSAVQTELQRLRFPVCNLILNPAAERGMFSSIQCAASWQGWNKGLTHWAVVLGDQPHLRRETLETVLAFAFAHPEQVCQPARHGRPRHPVLLPKPVFARLGESTASDLKQFLACFSSALCEIDDPGLDLDMDRPEDYQRAVKMFTTPGRL